MQYTPSIPEFLTLAGKVADGLIWVGSSSDYGSKFNKYKNHWMKKFNKGLAGLYAVATRDAFEIWV